MLLAERQLVMDMQVQQGAALRIEPEVTLDPGVGDGGKRQMSTKATASASPPAPESTTSGGSPWWRSAVAMAQVIGADAAATRSAGRCAPQKSRHGISAMLTLSWAMRTKLMLSANIA